MPGIIHVLSDTVANQIAAGEVIQRPASVVKELMENAIDAGATSISVVVKDAGKTLIQVLDNGTGMSESDARICFERHATSKITEAADLFAIRTRGFRGEALASIAAVAEVTLKSRRPFDELGTEIRIKGSEIESQEPVQSPVGTNFQVKSLFYNIPARRKFLKSDHTEFRHIINEFNHIALTRPEIECKLIHNGTDILLLPPASLRKRIIGIFGKAVNASLIPLETETSLIRISGFIGKPEYARRTYGEQFFFVNQRFIRHPYFHKALMNGYDNILAPDHFPAYFIFFETDPSKIDVNIHPSKTEVKFEDERAIWQILLAAVREAIGRNNLSPSLDFTREGIIDIPVLNKATEVRIPEIETNPGYNPFDGESSYLPGNRNRSTYQDDRTAGWERLFDPLPDHTIPNNKYLQIKNKYILSPVKSGLMVIDQRRAHERILYERILIAQERAQPLVQQTLFPETIGLNAADYQVCLEMMDELTKIGFDIRDFGNNCVVVHGIPSDMQLAAMGAHLEMMIEQYKTLQSKVETGHGDRIARATARTSAIGYGKSLSGTEMQELVDQLFACQNPNHTPSGKLIARIIELDDLDNYFKS